MDCKEAGILFESVTKISVVQIERSSVGIANYVFMISTASERFVLRCSQAEDAYQDTVYWIGKLSVCDIPIPEVLWEGNYDGYSYLILSYLPGDDIGNVYGRLSDSEKKQIAKEVAQIQRKVSGIDMQVEAGWKWDSFVEELLDRAEERIERNHYFDVEKVHTVRNLQQQIQKYLDQVRPTPYLDDISTKNLLINEGNVSGIIDVDWIGQGDVLTFVALTRVALLNMEQDTEYVDCLLEEFQVSEAEYKAFVFYCLIYCVDFMGERGTRFLDKTIPVNEGVIERLNTIFDIFMEEWKSISQQTKPDYMKSTAVNFIR